MNLRETKQGLVARSSFGEVIPMNAVEGSTVYGEALKREAYNYKINQANFRKEKIRAAKIERLKMLEREKAARLAKLSNKSKAAGKAEVVARNNKLVAAIATQKHEDYFSKGDLMGFVPGEVQTDSRNLPYNCAVEKEFSNTTMGEGAGEIVEGAVTKYATSYVAAGSLATGASGALAAVGISVPPLAIAGIIVLGVKFLGTFIINNIGKLFSSVQNLTFATVEDIPMPLAARRDQAAQAQIITAFTDAGEAVYETINHPRADIIKRTVESRIPLMVPKIEAYKEGEISKLQALKVAVIDEQKAEYDREVAAKAEADRIAKEAADLLASEKAKAEAAFIKATAPHPLLVKAEIIVKPKEIKTLPTNEPIEAVADQNTVMTTPSDEVIAPAIAANSSTPIEDNNSTVVTPNIETSAPVVAETPKVNPLAAFMSTLKAGY